MSRMGVTSRPGTQGSRLPVLPAIQHPLSAMTPGPVDLGGPICNSGRPLAAEQDYKVPKRLSTAGSKAGNQQREVTPRYETIPEGVMAVQGDPDKTRLPVFGRYPFKIFFFADDTNWDIGIAQSLDR